MPILIKIIKLYAVIILIGSISTNVGFAQSSRTSWSEPILLFEGSGSIREPFLIADQKGIVHLFWSYNDSNGMLIFYMRKDTNGWSIPLDVIAMETAVSPTAVVDDFGYIHLVWQGPNNVIYYSNAKVDEALSALNWIAPRGLDQSLQHAQITIANNSNLYIAYPRANSFSPYIIESRDYGTSWSSPKHISSYSSSNILVDFVRIATDNANRIHVVWTEFQSPDGWPPVGVYYSRSIDQGETWSKPVEMAGPDFLEATVTTSNDNIVDVAWNGRASVSGRYHVRSSNGGESWSAQDQIAPTELGGGSTGPPSIAVDSNGMLHSVVNTKPNTQDFTMYSYWNESSWSPLINLSEMAPDSSQGLNEESFMAISQGNQLHVVFYFEEHRLWYTTKETNSPHISSVDYVDKYPDSFNEFVPTKTITLINKPIILSQIFQPSPDNQGLTLNWLIISIITPVIIIIIVIFLLSLKRSR